MKLFDNEFLENQTLINLDNSRRDDFLEHLIFNVEKILKKKKKRDNSNYSIEYDSKNPNISLINGGRSGAYLIKFNYFEDQQEKSLLLKFNDDVKKERLNYETYYESMKLHKTQSPEIYSTNSVIGYTFIENAETFEERILENIKDPQILNDINSVFNVVRKWQKTDLRREKSKIPLVDNEIDKILDRVETFSATTDANKSQLEEIKTLISILRKSKDLNLLLSNRITHGDLNLRNILYTSSSKPHLIDFDKTSYKMPFAFDYVRLEREIKFNIFPNEIDQVCSLVDYSFNIQSNGIHYTNNTPYIVKLIMKIREEYWESVSNFSNLPYKEYRKILYMSTLAYDQLKLLSNEGWIKRTGNNYSKISNVLKSTKNILNQLIESLKTTQEFSVFVCRPQDHNQEDKILVSSSPKDNSYVLQGGDIKEFFNVNQLIHNFTEMNYNPLESFNVLQKRNTPKFADPYNYYSHRKFIEPVINRIVFNCPFKCTREDCQRIHNTNFKFVPKYELLNYCESDKVLHSDFQNIFKADKIYNEIGRRTLECVDILLFDKSSEVQDVLEHKVALIYRSPRADDVDQNGGWEYPKGGMQVHEHPLEAAYRELFEEMNPTLDANIQYLTYLGFQTVDVSNRSANRDYDVLRVHGFAFKLNSNMETLQPTKRTTGEQFSRYKFEALKKIKGINGNLEGTSLWISKYAIEFFNRYIQYAKGKRDTVYTLGNTQSVRNLYNCKEFRNKIPEVLEKEVL